jgi:hypothetical protein
MRALDSSIAGKQREERERVILAIYFPKQSISPSMMLFMISDNFYHIMEKSSECFNDVIFVVYFMAKLT